MVGGLACTDHLGLLMLMFFYAPCHATIRHHAAYPALIFNMFLHLNAAAMHLPLPHPSAAYCTCPFLPTWLTCSLARFSCCAGGLQDCVLIHWPGVSKTDASSPKNAELRLQTWRVLEALHRWVAHTACTRAAAHYMCLPQLAADMVLGVHAVRLAALQYWNYSMTVHLPRLLAAACASGLHWTDLC